MAATSRAGNTNISRLPRPAWAAAALLLGVLAFYVYTLQPSLAWGDGTRLQREAITGESFILAEMVRADFAPDPFPFARLGVAAWDHPLYVILTHLAVRALPAVDSLWLVNLASAVFAVGAVAFIFLLVWDHTRSLAATVLSSVALAVSHTFWFHAVTPEVYTLLACLVLGSAYALLRYTTTGRLAWLLAATFTLGLAAANHLLAFLALPIVGFVLGPSLRSKDAPLVRSLVRPLALAALAFLLGFAPYLIQFARLLRTFPVGDLMGPAFGATFFSAVTGNSVGDVLTSAITLAVFLVLQFNPLGVALGVVGLWRGARQSPLLWRLAVGGLVVYGLFGILYRVADQFAFFLPAYLFFALAMGLGLAECLARWPARRGLWLAGAALGVAAMPILYGLAPGLARAAGASDATLGVPVIGVGVRDGLAYYINPNKRNDVAAYRFGAEALDRLPPNALVLAEWYTDTDEYFVLRYFIAVEGRRPDVEVAGWPTEDPFTFDPATALRLVEDSLPTRPVYLASLSDEFYAASTLAERYCLIPDHNLYRVLPEQGERSDCLRP